MGYLALLESYQFVYLSQSGTSWKKREKHETLETVFQRGFVMRVAVAFSMVACGDDDDDNKADAGSCEWHWCCYAQVYGTCYEPGTFSSTIIQDGCSLRISSESAGTSCFGKIDGDTVKWICFRDDDPALICSTSISAQDSWYGTCFPVGGGPSCTFGSETID